MKRARTYPDALLCAEIVSEVYQCRGEIELGLSYAGPHTRPLSAESVGWKVSRAVAAIDACFQRPFESALGVTEPPSPAGGRSLSRLESKEARDDAMMDVQKARASSRFFSTAGALG